MHQILTQVFDLGGTFVFAISGGIVAARRLMDIFGVLVLAFAAVVAGGHVLHVQPIVTTVVGALLCFALRFMAIQYGWHLPSASWPERDRDGPDLGEGGAGQP